MALLGDMLELGAFSNDLHYCVGEHFGAAGVRLFAFGESAQRIADGASSYLSNEMITSFLSTEDKDINDIAASIAHELKAGDCILIKASRRMAAERVTAALSDILGK